jgi:hypothetical protein
MNTLPTAEEKKELDKLPKAKNIHFVLLVVLICIASLTFLVPDASPLLMVFIGACIFCVSVSAMILQYFARCPRCNARRSKGHAVCTACGLQYYASEVKKQDHELDA